MMRTRKGHKVYPLTVAQKFHFFYLDFCPKKEVMNIGTSLTIATDIDWEVLKQSIYKAYERAARACGSGSAKIKRETAYQYIADKEERDIELVDFSDKTEEEAAAVMRQWTCVPFKFQDSPMNRIVMIKMPEGYNGIYFLGDHRIVDAPVPDLFPEGHH